MKKLFVICLLLVGCVSSHVSPIKQSDIQPIINPIQPIVKPCSLVGNYKIVIDNKTVNIKTFLTIQASGDNFLIKLRMPDGVLVDGRSVDKVTTGAEIVTTVDRYGGIINIDTSALPEGVDKKQFVEQVKLSNTVFSKTPVKTGDKLYYFELMQAFSVVKGMAIYNGRRVIVSELSGDLTSGMNTAAIKGYSYMDAEFFQPLYSYVTAVSDGVTIKMESTQTIL